MASVTDALVNIATHIVRDLGYGGVFAMIMCSAVIFVPGTEPVMLFAGFDVYQGRFSLIGIIIAGVAGDLVGATIAYLIGYFGLVELLERLPGPLKLGPEEIERAHRWFGRYGAGVMAASRCFPFARAGFPYAAGVARMRYPICLVMMAIGSTVWISVFALIGRAVGHDWPSWRSHLAYVDYAVVALVVAVALYFLFRRMRQLRAAT